MSDDPLDDLFLSLRRIVRWLRITALGVFLIVLAIWLA